MDREAFLKGVSARQEHDYASSALRTTYAIADEALLEGGATLARAVEREMGMVAVKYREKLCSILLESPELSRIVQDASVQAMAYALGYSNGDD